MNPYGRFRVVGLVMLLVGLTLGLPGAAAGGGSDTNGTRVAGAWQVNPSLFPTGGDIQNCNVASQALGTLNGAFVGVWHEVAMKSECDQSKLPNSLPYRNSGTGTLDGIYFGDQRGISYTWTGTWTGDAISGQATGEFLLTPTDRRAKPRCRSFRLTFDGFVNFTTSFGGYNGTWPHACQ